MIRSAAVMVITFVATSALVCGSATVVEATPAAETRQSATAPSLKIRITGVPRSARPVVTVTGPHKYRRVVTSTQTLRRLAPGRYTVVAKNLLFPNGDLLKPVKPTQRVRLGTGAKTVTVAYKFIDAPQPPPQLEGTVSAPVRSASGEAPDRWTAFPSMSPDGRWLAFSSLASNLVPGSPDEAQVYLLDRSTGQLTLVSHAAAGGPAHGGWSGNPSVSDDGRFVTYGSAATDLTDTAVSQGSNVIYLWDRQTGLTSVVSQTYDGHLPNAGSYQPRISGDGHFVVYQSQASDLLDEATYGPDGNARPNIFLWDRTTGDAVVVDHSPDGAYGAGFSETPALSRDGRFITYSSNGDDLAPGSTKPSDEFGVFLWDQQLDATTFIATGGVPAISEDGSAVAYGQPYSDADPADVVLWQRGSGTSQVVSQAPDDSPGNDFSSYPQVSATGAFVTFLSQASNLVAHDQGSGLDAFVWTVSSDKTALISRGRDGEAAGATTSGSGVPVSADGSLAVFESDGIDLVTSGASGSGDVLLWKRT